MKLRMPLHSASVVIKIIVLGLGVALVTRQSAELNNLPVAPGDVWNTLKVLSVFWLGLLPQVFYLLAAWTASSVFARIGRGDAFGPALVKGLRGTGGHLVYGAAAALLIVPTLSPMLLERFRGLRYDAEIESFTIGLIGIVLYLLAQQGQALKSELEQFV